MRPLVCFALLGAVTLVGAAPFSARARPAPGLYDVAWESVSWRNSATKPWTGSMPLGNGDLGLNVWVEESGDLVFLIGKTDAWSENGELLKLGRVRLHLASLSSSPLDPKSFRQVLKPEEGMVEVYSPATAPAPLYRIWVDANRPVAHVEVHAPGGKPVGAQADVELWRNAPREVRKGKGNDEFDRGFRELGDTPGGLVVVDPDTVLPAEAQSSRLAWCHHNGRSLYPGVLANQHLEALLPKYPDPLLDRTFGAVLQGPGFVPAGDRTLKLADEAADFRLDLYALTATEPDAAAWGAEAATFADLLSGVNLETARAAHRQWWREFWDRSWIVVDGAADASDLDAAAARAVTQGYAMQRWMSAGAGRSPSAMPIKSNGSIFTVGRELDTAKEKYDPAKGDGGSPDFRAGGGNFTFQNTRPLYWPMLASGDYDLMLPFFQCYRNNLALMSERTQLAFRHAGVAFPETFFFWGTPNDGDFGVGNKDALPRNPGLRYDVESGLELIALMLDYYDATQDSDFCASTLLPVADGVTTYYEKHWQRGPGPDGKIVFSPAQSLGTYLSPNGNEVVNPLPDIAGLQSILPRLIALPRGTATDAQRAMWKKTLADLPALPRGKTGTGKNNVPDKVPIPSAAQNADGAPIFLPAQAYGQAAGVENPEEYAVFPYGLYGVGLPDLAMALNTFRARNFADSTGPTCDGIVAACLGLGDAAKREAIRSLADDKDHDTDRPGNYPNYTAYSTRDGGERFKWFWKPGRDWEPDMDNGGAGQEVLQSMLMQQRGNGAKILLFPAWPKEWNVSFKLHAARNTTVEGVLKDGRLGSLVVTPPERRGDVVVMEPQ